MSKLEETWKHDYITTNGVRLHYVTQGKGPLMLMLHGFPEFWYSWRHQIPEFARNYQVVALDLRGYNKSEKPKERSAYSMSELVQDVEGVIQELGDDRCVLVGHDWGGAIAWNQASDRPNLVEKLIVMNIPHPAKLTEGLRSLAQLQKSWYIFFFQLPFIPEFMFKRKNYRAISSAFLDMAIDKSAFTEIDLKAYQEAASKPGAIAAMLNYYRNIFPGLLETQQWEPLEIQTLMIWGEKDAALGKELTDGTDAYVKDLQLRYIPNCSHWVQQEQPKLVNQYMGDFLTSKP